jgi:formate dehydrogenase iron-sulfur subunit
MAEKAILFDATRCMACRGCQVACKRWNDLGVEPTKNEGTYENPPDLSASTWIKMGFREISEGNGVKWLFTRRSCMHCTDAACVEVCPTKALQHHELGFVTLDGGKCNGCGYCVKACPFDVPRLRGSTVTGWGKSFKCIFCADRVTNGLAPACVQTCPTQALTFGDRYTLVKMGRDRVASLSKNHPNARLYGENELKGLHVLYVLDDRAEVYGLPEYPRMPSTAIAWQEVLQPLGWGAAALVTIGLGINYIIARRKIKTGGEE